MASRKIEIGLALAIVAIVVVMVVRALDGGEDSEAVAVSDARQALRQLPYRYRFRDVGPSDGAERVVAGTAYGPAAPSSILERHSVARQIQSRFPEREPRGRWS